MNLKKYYKIITYKRISGLVISLTAIASVLIILFTIYGSQVGNFVVSIEDRNRYNLALSETETFAKQFSRLTAKGIKDMTDATYADIPDNLHSLDGNNNDSKKKYLAYSFYLKNMSNSYVKYNAKLSITKATKNIDSAIRIMVINNSKEEIYAQPMRGLDGSIDWISRPAQTHMQDTDYSGKPVIKKYTTTPFLSAVTVYETFQIELKPNGVDKYTVVFWLEGMDEDCTNELMGGTLKSTLTFSL